MIRREGENDLSRTSIEAAIEFLFLDGTQQTVKICQHDAVSEFGARVDRVDFATVLGDGSKRDDVVQVPAETGFRVVDVIDQSLDVLFRAYC